MVESLRQKYHLEPKCGLLNDPNGLTFYKGKYHVFFQWNRFKKDHSYKEWGHFSSEDMITWDFDGSAIFPDQSYDINGVYSGSSYVIGEKLYLFYTGNVKRDGKRKSSQCLAVSEDGRSFLKKGVVLDTPENFTEHFRDPKVWKGKRQEYFMVVGAQRKNGKGAIALCRSINGDIWEYVNVLAKTELYEMVECPDLFSLNGEDVLLFNPQKRDNTRDIPLHSFAAYKIGRFDQKSCLFYDGNLDCKYKYMDYGFDFYAPQTFQSPDRRRILFAWMSRMEAEQEQIFAKQQPNIHCLTMPRELFVKNGSLCQCPVKEMYEMVGTKVEVFEDEEGRKRAYPSSRAFLLKICGIAHKKQLLIDLHNEEAKIEYRPLEKTVTFSRKNWVTGEMEFRHCFLETLETVEVWSDQSSLEVFLNNGMAVFSSRIFPNGTELQIDIEGVEKFTTINVNEIQR